MPFLFGFSKSGICIRLFHLIHSITFIYNVFAIMIHFISSLFNSKDRVS